jgi:DhnA family fructose-bisphosphate aldolase class Ia
LTAGRDLRISKIIDKKETQSFILEADIGGILGPAEGLKNLHTTLKNTYQFLDAIIINIGQIDKLIHIFKGKKAPSLILRSDWTNVYRKKDYILSPETLQYTNTLKAEDAIKIGADSIAVYLIVGYENDDKEASNIEAIAEVAQSCNDFNIPFLAQILPLGDRVTQENYCDCIKLAVRQTVETGADMVSTPFPGNVESLQDIIELTKTPVFLHEDYSPTIQITELTKMSMKTGANGIIIGRRSLEKKEFPNIIKKIFQITHPEEYNRSSVNGQQWQRD